MSDHASSEALLDFPSIAALDDEDKARLLTTFLGGPDVTAPALHYVHGSSDGKAPAYVFDDQTGMVYILD